MKVVSFTFKCRCISNCHLKLLVPQLWPLLSDCFYNDMFSQAMRLTLSIDIEIYIKNVLNVMSNDVK